MKMPFAGKLRLALTFPLLCAFTAAALAHSAVEPVPRDAAWVARHEGFVAIAKQGSVDVLFLGDSITDFWRREDPKAGGKRVWDANFAAWRVANFGISGDRTQHLLWRLQNGELDGIRPKVVVLMIGTNNAGLERDGVTPRNTAPEAAEGVTAIVRLLQAKLPDSKILLLGVFPRAENADSPVRLQVREINALIARLDDGKNIRYLDIGPKFLAADGTLSREIMPDFLHPNEKGYEIWAAAIKEPLAAMLK